MSTALGIVYIVAEAEHCFLELIHILKSDIDFYPFAPAFQKDRLVDHLFILIQFFNESDYAFRFAENDRFRFLSPEIIELDRQLGIQIGCFMKTALEFRG